MDFGFSNSLVFLFVYLFIVLGATFISHRSENKGVLTCCYYVIVVPIGIVLSDVLRYYGHNTDIVRNAVLITTLTTTIMLLAGLAWKDMFLSFGRVLFISLIGLVLVSIVCMFIGIYPTWISYLSAGIFSVYIGYDISFAQSISRTYKNAVLCSMNLYLDIINLFMDILNILGNND